MAKIYYLTGLPGVGKSTVAKKAIEGLNITIVNYGTEMLTLAKESGLVNDRDEIRLLNKAQTQKLQVETTKRIKEQSKDILLDTHLTVPTEAGYLIGFPEYILKEIPPEIIFIVEAKVDEIMARREKDIGLRKRDYDFDKRIEEELNINRAVAAATAVLTGAKIKIINNNNGGLDSAAEELRRALVA